MNMKTQMRAMRPALAQQPCQRSLESPYTAAQHGNGGYDEAPIDQGLGWRVPLDEAPHDVGAQSGLFRVPGDAVRQLVAPLTEARHVCMVHWFLVCIEGVHL